MHQCEFCSTSYPPRPQVKRPRACPQCQHKRQTANEKEWRERNTAYNDSQYHLAKRVVRLQKLGKFVENFLEILRIGSTFKSLPFDQLQWKEKVTQFFTSLGVRQLNKLWGTAKVV